MQCVHTYRANRIDPLQVFHVNTSGYLTWLERFEYGPADYDWNRRNAGKEAGYFKPSGSLVLQYCGRQKVVRTWLTDYGHSEQAGYVQARERDTARNNAGNTKSMAQCGNPSPEHRSQ